MGAKHKKTRKEKIIADYRHQVYILENKSSTDPVLDKPTLTIAVDKNYYFNAHILKDILKTGILTFSIVTAQIILFFLLKRHIFSIPNLNY